VLDGFRRPSPASSASITTAGSSRAIIAIRCWWSCTDGVGSKLKIATYEQISTRSHDLVAMSSTELPLHRRRAAALSRLPGHAQDDPAFDAGLDPRHQRRLHHADCALVGAKPLFSPISTTRAASIWPAFALALSSASTSSTARISNRRCRPRLASSGLHSNGYSLVRKVVFDHAGLLVDQFVPARRTVGEALLEPTRLYVRPVKRILSTTPVKKRVVRG